jgi:hypothetical protein
MLSAPVFAYRGVMLAWALWIVIALRDWLRWAWGALSAGGIWRQPSVGASAPSAEVAPPPASIPGPTQSGTPAP